MAETREMTGTPRSAGRQGRPHPGPVLGLLAGGLVAAVILVCACGAVGIPGLDVVRMALNRLPFVDLTPTWRAGYEDIFFLVRLPRVIGGALVGAALATAGALFQGLFRNPMADPYVIGTSAGAALGATVGMLFPTGLAFVGFGLVPLASFLGALGTVLLVYRLARGAGRTPVVTMLLAGFVVSAFLGALFSLLMALAGRLSLNLQAVYAFLMGRISVTGWGQLAVVAPLVMAGVLLARPLARPLNALTLGEEGAAYLGVNVERVKLLTLALGSLLTAAVVTISGLVGFVGLVMPHALRLVLGPDHRLLLPATALGGALFVVLADTLARSLLAPTEIPLGAITAIIGAPFFLYQLRRSRGEYGL